ncbi:MAG: HD domain-containing protein [bacterium]
MIKIERTEYAFASLDASPDEWAAIKAIVSFCASHFNYTELRYSLPFPEEQRHGKIESLIEAMNTVWGNPPIEDVYRDDLFLIANCITHTDGKDLPNVNSMLQETLVRQLQDIDVYHLFDDAHVTPAQWDLWNCERRIHDTKSWIIALHAKQTDKAGHPYAQHPLRVQMRLLELFPSVDEDTRHAALLHDVMEDCGITAGELRRRGYSERTIQTVAAVTKNKNDGLTYGQRISQLADNGPLAAIQVKLCDLLDNNDPNRLSALSEEQSRSLNKRYSKAIQVLKARLTEL